MGRKNKYRNKNKKHISELLSIKNKKEDIVSNENNNMDNKSNKMEEIFLNKINNYFENNNVNKKYREELISYAYTKFEYIKSAMKNANILSKTIDEQIKILYDIYEYLHNNKKYKILQITDEQIKIETSNIDYYMINFTREISVLLNIEDELSTYVTNNLDSPFFKLLKKYDMNHNEYVDKKNMILMMYRSIENMHPTLSKALEPDKLLRIKNLEEYYLLSVGDEKIILYLNCIVISFPSKFRRDYKKLHDSFVYADQTNNKIFALLCNTKTEESNEKINKETTVNKVNNKLCEVSEVSKTNEVIEAVKLCEETQKMMKSEEDLTQNENIKLNTAINIESKDEKNADIDIDTETLNKISNDGLDIKENNVKKKVIRKSNIKKIKIVDEVVDKVSKKIKDKKLSAGNEIIEEKKEKRKYTRKNNNTNFPIA